jgi:hypothetical protein
VWTFLSAVTASHNRVARLGEPQAGHLRTPRPKGCCGGAEKHPATTTASGGGQHPEFLPGQYGVSSRSSRRRSRWRRPCLRCSEPATSPRASAWSMCESQGLPHLATA